MATAPEPYPRRFTVEEYLRMGESGIIGPEERVELIEGEVIKMTPIGTPHAGTVNRLVALPVRSAGDSALVSAQNPVRLGDLSMPQPDLALLKARSTFYTDAHPDHSDGNHARMRCSKPCRTTRSRTERLRRGGVVATLAGYACWHPFTRGAGPSTFVPGT